MAFNPPLHPIGVKLRKSILSFIVKSPSFPPLPKGDNSDSPLLQRGVRGDFPGNLIRLIRIIIHKFLNLTLMPLIPSQEGTLMHNYLNKRGPLLGGAGGWVVLAKSKTTHSRKYACGLRPGPAISFFKKR